MGLTNTYDAFCLDEALGVLVGTIEEKLDQISDDDPKRAEAARRRFLHELLGIEDANTPKRFADPAAKF